jgi:hypothetical protein
MIKTFSATIALTMLQYSYAVPVIDRIKEISPEELVCAQDVKECADGTYVSRDIKNKCRFKQCPKDDQLVCA